MISRFEDKIQKLNTKKNTFKSLNVHVSVFEEIKKIAIEDNRSLSTTIALIVKETLNKRQRQKITTTMGGAIE